MNLDGERRPNSCLNTHTFLIGRVTTSSVSAHLNILDGRHGQRRAMKPILSASLSLCLGRRGRRLRSRVDLITARLIRKILGFPLRLLIHRMKSALFFQSDAIGASSLCIGWRKDTPYLTSPTVAYNRKGQFSSSQRRGSRLLVALGLTARY